MARRKSLGSIQIQAEWWDKHEVVLIRDLNTEDDEWIQNQLAQMDGLGSKKVNMKLLLGTTKVLTLIRAITDWTLTDEQNQPLKLGEQAIRGLAPEDSSYIYEQINERNKPMSEEERKALLASAETGISANHG